jgi:predicted PurR-regulated permease PerM
MQEHKPFTASALEEMSGTMALPDIKTMFLGGIFLLIFLTLLHEACSIAIPIVLAFILKLVLQPIQRVLERLRFPRVIAASMIIFAVVISIICMATILSGPAAAWGKKIPDAYPQLQERLNFLSKPMVDTQKILVQADNLTKISSSKVIPVEVEGNRFSDKVFSGTQILASGLFTTILVLFFLLVSGDTFLRRLVEVLPTFKNKRQAVDISQQIERDISRYLLTISIMNAGVGILTAIVMRIYGIEDPLLWGAMAFLLNYVPIIGPLIAMMIFLFVGFLVINSFWVAILPATLYILIHLVESAVITPLLLSRRFTLNHYRKNARTDHGRISAGIFRKCRCCQS